MVLLLGLFGPAAAGQTATPWVEGHGSKVRMLAGSAVQGADSRLFAGVEIGMEQGWKTYWRSPGDSGGLPPHFDWSGSENLASARVLYPAPRRFRDAIGDSVGYAGSVVFPVEIHPKDPGKPVDLRLSLDYGVCREICVPAQAGLALRIAASEQVAGSPQISAALAAVPRKPDEQKPQDPRLRTSQAHLAGAKPRLILEAVFPAAAASGDLFIEAPGGVSVPLPVRTAVQADTVRFEVDLTQDAEPEALRGKSVLVTLVSDAGHSEARWTIK